MTFCNVASTPPTINNNMTGTYLFDPPDSYSFFFLNRQINVIRNSPIFLGFVTVNDNFLSYKHVELSFA
jgi:hypothetical protein